MDCRKKFSSQDILSQRRNFLKSSVGWNNGGNGSNASGFTALPGGYRNTHGGFIRMYDYGIFWTGTQSDTISWFRSLHGADAGVYRLKTLRSQGFSVRCLKDDL